MWRCLSLFLNARIFNIDLRRDFSLIFFSNGDQFYLCSYFIFKKKLYILFLYFCFLFQKRSAYVAAPYDPSLYWFLGNCGFGCPLDLIEHFCHLLF